MYYNSLIASLQVDIFSMELVLFPIHLGMHWCLAAADFRTSTLSYYDSLLGNNSSCLPRLKYVLLPEAVAGYIILTYC